VQNPPGDEEPCAVGGGVVGQAHVDAVFGELVGVGGFDDDVAVDARVGDLARDVLVGEADDQPERIVQKLPNCQKY
jgi:hypothetical protein